MSLKLQIIRLHEFIRLGPSGKFDPKGSKAGLALLAAACLKRGILQALLDLRALRPGPEPVFSPDDLVSLVSTFREIGFTSRHRLAVLYVIDPHERARMFASIARLRGWTVKAFEDFEQAVAWLSDAAPAQPEAQAALSTRKRRVPVRKLKDKQSSPTVPAGSQPIRKIPQPGPKPARIPATQSKGATC